MFENLKNETVKYFNERTEKETAALYAGDAFAKHNATAKRIEQLNNGVISLEKFNELTAKRIAKMNEKKCTEYLKRIENAETAPDFTAGSIYVYWKRSRTWGYHPHAEFYSENNSVIYDSASGCGYDKLSAAVAGCLNKNVSIMKALYQKEDMRLIESPETSRRDYIGYGCGSWFIPYFEGGVGQSSLNKVLENCGFRVTWHETKTTDTIIITK